MQNIKLMLIITLIIFQPNKNPAPNSKGNAVTLIFRRCPVRTPAETLAIHTHDFTLSLPINIGIIIRLWQNHLLPHLVQFIIYLSSCLLTYLFTYLPTYLLNYLLTYSLTHSLTHTHSMEHSPSWEPNRLSGSQEIPHILWNPEVHCRVYKTLPPAPVLSHINLVHVPHPTSWKSILILSSHLCLGFPSGPCPTQVSPPKPWSSCYLW